MRRELAAVVLALWLTGLTVYTVSHAQPAAGNTGVTTLVHQYLEQIEQANGIHFDVVKLLAYRQHGNTSIARVKVSFEGVECDAYTGTCHTAEQTRTVVFRWERTPWTIQNFKVADQ